MCIRDRIYVSAISILLFLGRSTPSIRAIVPLLSLTLLVAWILAYDANDSPALNHTAFFADAFD